MSMHSSWQKASSGARRVSWSLGGRVAVGISVFPEHSCQHFRKAPESHGSTQTKVCLELGFPETAWWGSHALSPGWGPLWWEPRSPRGAQLCSHPCGLHCLLAGGKGVFGTSLCLLVPGGQPAAAAGTLWAGEQSSPRPMSSGHTPFLLTHSFVGSLGTILLAWSFESQLLDFNF